jgi:hypothetical protein
MARVDQPVLEVRVGDVLRLRRTHPCGGTEWSVDRIGADIGLRCGTCGRRLLMDRRTLERRISAFVSRGTPVASSDEARTTTR